MTKQVIVVNKSLNMSKGKMSAQVSHAAMAPFFKDVLLNPKKYENFKNYDIENQKFVGYTLQIPIDFDTFEWLTNSYTKVICEVKNEQELQKVINKAIANGLIEDKDFFKIIDNGLTEFNGEKTWTCIGFKPMESSKIDKVTKRLRLFKED